jgi:ABC-2 type transport system permease protein
MSQLYDSSKRGSIVFEELRAIIKYRDLIFQLVRRDIVTRYKRSALGITWTMLNPLGIMIVLTLVFSRLFQTVQQYPTYVLSGLIAWTFFSQTTTAALAHNIWGGALLHRIYLPRTSFTVSSIGTGLANFILSIIPLIIIMAITRTPIHLTILFIPFGMLLLAAFALGIGLLLSTLAISFPDVVDMYQIGLTAWMYLTPIIYPPEIIPMAYRVWLINLNPMYHLLQVFRLPIYEGVMPSIQTIGLSSAIALSTLIVGWSVFCHHADSMNYRT